MTTVSRYAHLHIYLEQGLEQKTHVMGPEVPLLRILVAVLRFLSIAACNDPTDSSMD